MTTEKLVVDAIEEVARKPWSTPHVILGTLNDTDGGPFVTFHESTLATVYQFPS
jgi:hypothetical protein